MRTLLVIAFVAACSPGSGDDGPRCNSDLDCGAQLCVDGRCADCASNGDCQEGLFCCQGICRPDDEIQDRCGCAPSPAGSAGVRCGDTLDDAMCLVDGAVASAANVAQGDCGCGCTVAQGGPICGEAGDDGVPQCICATNADCGGASLDADGRPHRVANTCTPDSTCVCLTSSAGPVAPCDIAAASPDCSFDDGCRALLSDEANCGVAGRSCLDPTTGIAGTGSCKSGGCTCDDLNDCSGTAINVNSCAFVVSGEPASCVCGGYTRGGLQAACPMELECQEGGCILDGTVVHTEEDLLSALGLPLP